jgi:glycosyltransferase involved in cell wall biosynthesis
VSHTFILREVAAVRELGIEIRTFSVRKSTERDILGPQAEKEVLTTRSLLPLQRVAFFVAVLHMCLIHPLRSSRVFAKAIFGPDLSAASRWRRLLYFGEAVLLASWLVRGDFDHLHCHFGNSGSTTGMFAAELAGIPFSFTCHGSELNQPIRFSLAEKVGQAAFVVCVSKFGKARLMYLSPPEHWEKLHVVHCGLLAPNKVASDSPQPVPQETLQKGILCVGRLAPEKGHLVLLDALALLAQQGLPYHCTIVGDGPLRAAIEAKAQTLRLTNFLTFTGSVDPARVAALCSIADVVVLASFTEGIPVVLMEAMAQGKPVVATRVGGVPELVENGITGLVVAPGDAQELADALYRILNDSKLAREMGTRGCSVVTKDFNLAVSASRLKSLFQAVPAKNSCQAKEVRA